MTITAKYPGRCDTCGNPITPGMEIEWRKGARPVHTACTPSGRRLDRQAAARPYGRRKPGAVYSSAPAVSRRLREPKDGEQIIHRNSAEYETGQTLHATRIPGGGGADGHYWTVVAAASHRITEWEDDTREGERRYDAIVRPATEAEAAACAARIAEAQATKAAREDALRSLSAGEGQGRGWSRPAGSRTISRDPGRPGSYASYPYLVADPDGVVYHVCPVYDDDPCVTRLPLTVEQAIAAARLAGWTIQ